MRFVVWDSKDLLGWSTKGAFVKVDLESFFNRRNQLSSHELEMDVKQDSEMILERDRLAINGSSAYHRHGQYLHPSKTSSLQHCQASSGWHADLGPSSVIRPAFDVVQLGRRHAGRWVEGHLVGGHEL